LTIKIIDHNRLIVAAVVSVVFKNVNFDICLPLQSHRLVS